MTFERFIEILETYGSDPSRWPVDERIAAEHLAARDSRAAEAMAQMRRFDEVLDTYDPVTDVSIERARQRIEKAVSDMPSATTIPFVAAWSPWQRAAAMAAVLMFGIATGMMTSAVSPSVMAGEMDAARLVMDGGPLEAMGL